jgi:hypothetical protein
MNVFLCQWLDPAAVRLEYAGMPHSLVAPKSPDSLLPMRQEAGDVAPTRRAPTAFSPHTCALLVNCYRIQSLENTLTFGWEQCILYLPGQATKDRHQSDGPNYLNVCIALFQELILLGHMAT